MRRAILSSFAAAALLLLSCGGAQAGFGFSFGYGGWGAGWPGPGPGGWGPSWGWGALGPGWWGPSPYYNYYNGVQDGVNAGLLLGQLERLNGVRSASAGSAGYRQVISEIESQAQQLAQNEANDAAALVSGHGIAAALSSLRAGWQSGGYTVEEAARGAEERLGVSGFSQNMRILYILNENTMMATVIVGASRFQLRESASAAFTLPQ
ncbi:MAG: hypothetical protein Q4D58_09490 [Synergistaceae bacterium]|nr:hypothetical protein [Synergistaceae bacterium]